MCLKCMRIDLFSVESVLKLCLLCAEGGLKEEKREIGWQDSCVSRCRHTNPFPKRMPRVCRGTPAVKRHTPASQ